MERGAKVRLTERGARYVTACLKRWSEVHPEFEFDEEAIPSSVGTYLKSVAYHHNIRIPAFEYNGDDTYPLVNGEFEPNKE